MCSPSATNDCITTWYYDADGQITVITYEKAEPDADDNSTKRASYNVFEAPFNKHLGIEARLEIIRNAILNQN